MKKKHTIIKLSVKAEKNKTDQVVIYGSKRKKEKEKKNKYT